MKPTLTKALATCTFALVLIALTPGRAEAAVVDGYVCTTSFSPYSVFQIWGTKGHVWASIYSGPGCTGTLQQYGRFFSVGATSSWADANYLYSEASLLAVYRSLADAAISGARVNINYATPFVFQWLFVAAN